jgi:hypothetical protein
MSVVAAGYVLNVPSHRREMLLNEAENGGSFYRSSPPNFEHSRRAPLVVFASFEDGKITHIADGKRGASAGTGLARLNMQDLKALVRPITFDELKSGVPKRLQAHLERVLTGGGILQPKTLGAFVDRIRSRLLDRNALEADMMRGLPARQERDEISSAKQRSLTTLTRLNSPRFTAA